MKQRNLWSKLRVPIIFAMVLGLLTVYASGWQPVFAGTLTKSTILETNMVAGGTTNIAIEFTSATSGGTNVSVNLSNLSTSLTASPTVSGSSLNGCQGANGIFSGTITAINGTSVGDGSGIVTFTSSSTFASGTTYCTIITASGGLMTNPGAGTYTATITAGSDSQTQGLDVISSDTYTISGTVAQTFTMSLGSGSDTFTGNLSSTTDTLTNGETVTINTNAGSGWMLWAADANGGLYSTTKSQHVNSVAPGALDDLSTPGTYIGTNAFALGVTSVTAGSATTNYNDTTGPKGGGITATTTGFQQIASDSSADSSADNVTVKLIADIAATDPASNDYNDTITLVGAGSF